MLVIVTSRKVCTFRTHLKYSNHIMCIRAHLFANSALYKYVLSFFIYYNFIHITCYNGMKYYIPIYIVI